MEKVRYTISDAAQMMDVESHALRYWEEELDLSVPRNEQGHRYYTKENIEQFQKIKDLKEKGYQHSLLGYHFLREEINEGEIGRASCRERV